MRVEGTIKEKESKIERNVSTTMLKQIGRRI